ncbi:uncharacterized protein LOC121260323 [Juglans microcarpa x Juglans regia]|uniref:uncharacterized protein LOC121260323 n=1 Tax=Juglans microcarpa x Juglans regia TaxID=2249226 RepID=UPI001B7DC811|nr:uncharacterized protein LOC121260323 [Juglans microcarpa x Juglans regia]
MLKTKMKRVVSMDPYQSRPINEEARVNLKYQILLQEYLELQKEFISKKKRLQNATVNRETLSAEVRYNRPKVNKNLYSEKIQIYVSIMLVKLFQNINLQFWNDGERSLDKKERIVEKRPKNRLINK